MPTLSASAVFYLLAAVTALLLAHVVRAARWAVLFSPDDLLKRFHLLLGLALGYAANAVLPLRLGEVLRAWFVSRRTSQRLPYVAATVVAERLSDVLVVSLLSATVAWDGSRSRAWPISVLGVVAVALAVVFCLGVQRSPRVRRGIWNLASAFNNTVRFRLIDFAWTLGELVAGGALLRMRYLVASVLMWALYLLSYLLFAHAVNARFDQTFTEMMGAPLRSRLVPDGQIQWLHASALALFAGLPVLAVIAYGGLKQWPRFLRLMQARRRYGWYAGRAVRGGARHRFKAEAEYDYFLVSLFSGDNKGASRFGLEALEQGTVHKLYDGGSEAITALVEQADLLVIRKFASGEAGQKLKLQRDWLLQHRAADLALVQVLAGHATPKMSPSASPHAYYYDMPLVVPSNDFFDFIHSTPFEGSRTILAEVLEQVSALHMRHHRQHTARATIDKYLDEKAAANATRVLAFVRTLLPEAHYQVNGRPYHLDDWNRLLDPAWLSCQVELECSTVVHGDLTIENIIVAPGVGPGWYLIDPNPDNVFNSPLIDWAKMLQSLHLGYEGLNRHHHCTLDGCRISLPFTRSQVYTQLHQFVEALLLQQLGERALREAYFHELVHYLRLVPYKIRQNPQKGLAFFACTSVLLREYRERWDA